ncbi:MAG: DUF3795 domain-containing protein [Proteobacteria bacterium]|nr:DUF3795 domain-containing protein [Pseudomonadota bacterium]
MINKDLLAPCGLYCGVCAVLIADRDGNEKFKERLAPVYGCTPEQITCKGCLSDQPFVYCQACTIKTCTREKGYEGCHECSDFPCDQLDSFPMPVGKKVIMRAIPAWRELGTEKWVEAEEKRYHCPSCGSVLFRGVKRCRNCSAQVDVD